MIVKEELLSQLRQHFNLNLYEVKIWTALLSRGVSTAGELSDISNVPRSRAYDILESLEKKGFVMMKLGKPINYVAIEPQEVIERAKKYVKKRAQENVSKIERLKDSNLLKELDVLHKNGIEFIEPSDLSGALRGRNNIYMHLDTIMKSAKKEVCLVTTAEGLMRKFEQLKSTLQSLKKNKVKVRIAVPVNNKLGPYIKELNKYAEIKDMQHINSRFCLVDNTNLLFILNDENEVHPNYEVGVWVNTPLFTSTINDLFAHTWNDLPFAEKSLKKFK